MQHNKKLLLNANPEESFKLSNGRILKNLFELANSLTSMDDETFNIHVNVDKNDFENWIRYVFDDSKLADQVTKTTSKREMAIIINDALSKASSKVVEKKKEIKIKKKSEKPKKEPKPQKNLILEEAQKTIHELKEIEDGLSEISKKVDTPPDIAQKLDEILVKEKEIAKREEKITEIEARIESQLAEQKQNKENNKKDAKFFSKEFIQGIATGILLTLIVGLVYIKFFYF